MRGKVELLAGLAQRWAPGKKVISQISAFFLVLVILFSAVPFEADAASSTNNYWYNGVELPALPSDVSGKQYAIIQSSSGAFRLFYKKSSGSDLVLVDTELYGLVLRYYESDNVFGALGFYELTNGSWSKKSDSGGAAFSKIISSNQDLRIDGTEDIYFYSTFPLPYSQREIYSYGGFLAPDVFYSWSGNFVNYPNFSIFRNISTNTYYFYASVLPVVYNPVSFNSSLYTYDFLIPEDPNDRTDSSRYQLTYDNGLWVSNGFSVGGLLFPSGDYELIWSSVDVINEEDNSVFMDGSDAVKLGNLTSLYTVLPEDDKWEVKQGGCKRFEIASGQNLPIETVTWQLKGNIVSGTSIDYNGLLTVSSNQPLGTIYVVASNINGEGFSSEAAVTVLPEQTLNTDYVIRPQSTGTYYVGNSYNFSCVNSSGVPASSVVWYVYSDYVPIASGTYIDSSGTLHLSSSQNFGSLTIQASSINGTDTYTFYNISVFANMSGDDGGGGDNPAPSPTPGNQEVIDSIDEGFAGLGNKIDQLGNNIIAGFLEGLLRLFVPTTDELTAKMDSFKEWIDEQIPILAVPVALVQYTYDMFFGVTPELGVLTFPEVKWMDNILIERTELDLSQYTWLNDILPIIRTVLTVGCCLSFLYWVINKVKEVGKS